MCETRSQCWEDLLVLFIFVKFLLFISPTKSICVCVCVCYECLCIYVWEHKDKTVHVWGGQNTTFWSCFSHSKHMDTGNLTEVIFLAGSAFTFLVIYPAQGWGLWNPSEVNKWARFQLSALFHSYNFSKVNMETKGFYFSVRLFYIARTCPRTKQIHALLVDHTSGFST